MIHGESIPVFINIDHGWGGAGWGWYMCEYVTTQHIDFALKGFFFQTTSKNGDKELTKETEKFLTSVRRDRSKSLNQVGRLLALILEMDEDWVKRCLRDPEKLEEAYEIAETIGYTEFVREWADGSGWS